jgi:hypothetical protein
MTPDLSNQFSWTLLMLAAIEGSTAVADLLVSRRADVTRMIAYQDGLVYSTRCSAAYAVYRGDQWQRRSKHTELES